MKRSEITPEMAKLMSPEDQSRLGLSSQAMKPEKPKTPLSERKEQGDFWNWLLRNGYQASWHRTDRRTGAVLGVPDFIIPISKGRTIWIEMKVQGGRLTTEQQEFREYLSSNQHSYHLCFSADEAITLMKAYEQRPNLPTDP